MAPDRTDRAEPGYLIAKSILLPWIQYGFSNHFEGTENIPSKGPAIVAVNHISVFDPLAVAYAIHKIGRRPRFLAKSSLFETPFVGWVLRTARQIRVDRGSAQATDSLKYAIQALDDGEVVVIFPEGTTTVAPDLEPLPPKTGVARLALASGLPVIPCATWGGQWVWGYHVGFRPGLGKDVWVRFGKPLQLDEFRSRPETPELWDQISHSIMMEISVLLGGLKAAKPWTPRPLKKHKARGQAT